jgi:hypothetical protein
VKAVFGILGLVVVLAIVASLVKTQLHAVGGGASAQRNAAALPGAVAADPNATVPQQARALEDRARAETVRALEQGAERNRRADP